MLKKLSGLFILVLILMACEEAKSQRNVGKFGMSNTDVPEFAATEFFNEIYHSKNLDGAIKLSTPKMERLLRSYHTNKGVQKHVLNMRFDKVKIQPSTRSAGRNEYAQESEISLFFEGDLNGNILKDLRIVSLIRIDKEWRVDEVREK